MKIKLETYCKISYFFLKKHATEEGGIIGSSTKNVIDCFCPDYSASMKTRNLYAPNINNLNQQLRIWEKKGITFLGIIHSHLTNTPELSLADKAYIEKIMLLNSKNRQLFFPIVLYVENNINIFVYRAWIESESRIVHFCTEELLKVNNDTF